MIFQQILSCFIKAKHALKYKNLQQDAKSCKMEELKQNGYPLEAQLTPFVADILLENKHYYIQQ